MRIDIVRADYTNARHMADIPYLLDLYASDPMGGGTPLSEYAKENLVGKLAELPQAFSILAYVGGEPAGLANCFQGFSTFACQPLVNIHDLAVVERGRWPEPENTAQSGRNCRVAGLL